MQMLFTILKRKIFSILKLFNVELKIKKNLVKYNSYNAIHSFLASYFIKKSNFTFFDIGAHKGESIERFKKILKNITIHAFEPTPNLFELLKKKYSKENIFLNNLAVSDNDQAQTLYSYKHTLMNSMFPVKSNSKFQKSRILSTNSNTKEFEEKIEVKSITIDSYCNKNKIEEIDFLKIDTQGFEDKVLTGAKEMLRKNCINVIELELIIGIAFERTISFYDIENIVNKFNYKLISIDHAHNIIAYSNYQVNLIYVKQEIYKKIENLNLNNTEIPGVTKAVSKSHPYSY